MKKPFISLLAFLVFSISLRSQTPAIETDQWVEKPVIHAGGDKYSNEPAYIVYDKRRIEFIDDSKDNLLEFHSQHKIVHVNDDHGIEYFNKIYLQVSDFSDITDIKARTILPNGKTIELDKNNIKDLKDDDGNLYKIFAMEGLEKGSEIEYYYTARKQNSYFGKVTIQDKFPVMESHVELVTPARLVFETRIYNCDGKSQTDTLKNGKAVISLHFKEVAGAEEEKYSSYRVNLGRLEYKLSYNNATHPGERMFTWNELSKKLFVMYSSYTEKELKKTDELVNGNGWTKISGEPEKIMAVENYIKKNYTTRNEMADEDAENIEKIIKNKVSTDRGLMRLYGAIFQNLGINYQFVLTTDRNNALIDKNFENWDNCDFPLFYFPAENKFIAPGKIAFRYPLIFPSWGACYGLFCKNISIGTMNTAIAEIRKIPLEAYQLSFSQQETSLKLNPEMDTLRVDMKLMFGGYMASYYRENFNFLTPDQKHDIIKEMVKQTTASENIVSSELENEGFESANSSKPFILHAKVNSGDLLEKAGNKVLFKIGLVIGPQEEMYQEKERRTDVAIEYGHFEQRKIEFTIPEGYIIKNLDDLKMEQVYKENGIQTMGFVSGYELKDNLLTVRIMEDYRNTTYPVSQYEDFRKIINTSSDFNKVVLVLEKK